MWGDRFSLDEVSVSHRAGIFVKGGGSTEQGEGSGVPAAPRTQGPLRRGAGRDLIEAGHKNRGPNFGAGSSWGTIGVEFFDQV